MIGDSTCLFPARADSVGAGWRRVAAFPKTSVWKNAGAKDAEVVIRPQRRSADANDLLRARRPQLAEARLDGMVWNDHHRRPISACRPALRWQRAPPIASWRGIAANPAACRAALTGGSSPERALSTARHRFCLVSGPSPGTPGALVRRRRAFCPGRRSPPQHGASTTDLSLTATRRPRTSIRSRLAPPTPIPIKQRIR